MCVDESLPKAVLEKFLHYAGGQLYAHLRFANGLREGTQRYFYPSGALKTSENYSQGFLEGDVQLYWSNGRLKRQCQFVNGKRDGFDRIWNEEGHLVDEAFYERGAPQGIQRRWNSQGGLIEECERTVRSDTLGLTSGVSRAADCGCGMEPEPSINRAENLHDSQQETLQFLVQSEEIYTRNLSLLMERFPRLGLLVPSFAMEAQKNESLASPLPEAVQALYLYGLGGALAYNELKPWLSADPERLVIFLEDEPGQLAAFVSASGAYEILLDPQIEIEYGSFSSETLEHLAERFPFERIEVFAFPSRRTERFFELRLELLRKSALSSAIHVDRLHGYQPFHNFINNLSQLSRSFYANRLKGAFSGIPAIVCGAGPSLNHAAALLKTVEDNALLIAGGSTLAALSAQGVLPHFGMAIDPNLEEYRRLKNSFAFEVPLLYSTRVFPDIFQTCNGPIGYLRSGIGGMHELWVEEKLGLDDPLMGEHLSQESISVTAICLAWAQFLGCDPIFLSGVDLAYTKNRRYADGVLDSCHAQSYEEGSCAADRLVEKSNRRGETIVSAVRWVMEAASLSHLAKNHPEVRFFNTSDEGINLEHIPFIDLKEAIQTYLGRGYDLRAAVQKRIVEAPMPEHTASCIESEMDQMWQSLKRVIHHLEVLSGHRSGSKALAEVELAEEIAYTFFFYDAETILQRPTRSWGSRENSFERKWDKLGALAKKYEAVFTRFHRGRPHIPAACCAAFSH